MRIPRILAYFRRFVFAVFVTALTFLSPAFGDTFLYNSTPIESKFYVTTTSGVAGRTVKLYIKATGTFYIDWGDGNVTPHTTNSSSAAISHSYASGTCSNGCAIRFGWLSEPTAYPTGTGTTYSVSTISFYNAASDGLNKYITSVGGSLGALFPTLSGASSLTGNAIFEKQPRFISTFQGSTNLTGGIPSGLFSGLSGPFSENMFRQTFYQCSGLTGYIPDDLFDDLEIKSGTNTVGNVMYRTFYGASSMAQTCPTGTHNSESYNAYGSNWKTTTSATPTVVSCSLCEPGTYNGSTGQTSCTSCSSIGDGSYTESEIGATANSQCYKVGTTSCSCSAANAATCTGTAACKEYYNSGTCSIIDSNVCDIVSVTCESGYKTTTAGTACEPITYSISFNGNGNTGGSTSGMSNLSYGSPYTLTSNGFTRTGYDFDGWCVGATTCAAADKLANSASVSNLTTTDGATITLYAQWTPTPYTITLNPNGGTLDSGVVNPISYNIESGTVNLPDDPDITQLGYIFDGWCETIDCDSGNETPIKQFVPTSSNIGNKTYYAQWTSNACDITNHWVPDPNNPNSCICATGYIDISGVCNPTSYTITYNTNGGTLSGAYPTNYTIESSTTTLPDDTNITKLGYTFDGWYDNAGLTGTAVTSIATGSTGNKVYYASWTANTYTVTYTCDGVTAQTEQATYGTSYTGLDSANVCSEPTGYTLSSFSCDNGVTLPVSDWNIDSAVTCSATTSPKTYTVTYTCDGVTAQTEQATYGTSYTGLDSANVCSEPTGYTLGSFSCNNGVTLPVSDWNIDSAVTCSATLTPKTYTVTYTCDGVTAQEDTATYDVSYSVRDSANVCAAQGYTPSSFACVPNISSGTWNTDANVTCSATRTGNTIALTWANGGHGSAPATPATCTYGSTFDMPAALTETGWTFNKWNVNGNQFDGSQQNIVCNYDNLGVSANNATATITASWTANTINLTWTNGGHGTAPTTPTSCKYGSTFDMPAALTEIGWTFNKWNVNGNQFNGGATGVVCNYDNLGVSANNTTATITADWTLNTYTITYDTNSGSAVSNDTYDIMDTQPDGYNLATTSKTGYTFDGWCVYDSVQSTAPTTCNNSILMTKLSSGTTGNKWAYAKWTAMPYTITYDVKGGVAIANGSYTIESGTITLPTATKTNSDFVGWCTEDSELNPNCTILSGNQFTPDSADLGDKTFYAKWIIHCATGSIPNESNTACVCDVDGGYGSFAGTLEECTGTNRKLVYWNESDNVCYDNNENTSSSMCAGMYKRDWTISFKQNNVQKRYKGVAWCDSRNMGDVSEGSKSLPALGTPVGTPGTSCWCRIETYEPNVDNGTKLNVFVWLQILHKNSLSSCQENCADMCGSMIGHFGSDYSTLRLITNVLQNNVSPCVYSCPEGTSVNITNDGCVADSCTDSNNDGICDSVGGCASGYKFNSVTQECDLVEYTINYEEKGGEEVSDGRYTVLSPSVSLPTTTRTGYMFAGWCTEDSELNPNCTVLTNDTFVPDSSDLGDKTFYAKWTPITYTITYYTNDGTLDSGINNPTNYTIESSTITLPTGTEITRTGYVFAGWYNNPSLTGTAVTSVPSGSYGNKEYYAQWLNCASVAPDRATASVNVVNNACVYTITCDAGYSHNTGSGYLIDNIIYTGAVGELPSGITGCETPRVYLTWNPESADNAASVSGVGFCDVGATFNVPATEPARTGYTFAGWDVTSVTPSAGNGE